MTQKKVATKSKTKALNKALVSLQLVCDYCNAKKTKLGKYECKCGKGNFWVEQTN